MHYCIIINDLKAGGAQKATLDLVKALTANKNDVTLIILRNEIDLEIPKNISLHILENEKYFSGLLGKALTARKLKKLWLEINSSSRVSLTISRLQFTNELVFISKIPKPYYIIDNALSEEIKKLKKENFIKGVKRFYRYKKIYREANLIAVSKGVKIDLIENFNVSFNRVEQIYNPIDVVEIKKLSIQKIHDDLPTSYIIHVARAIGQKRHDLMLDAWKLVDTDIKLVLLTDNISSIQKLVAERNLQERCIVKAFTKNPFPLMAKARLLVLTSDFEGFGLVLVESVISGTPVIATDCNYGPEEILKKNYPKHLVPRDDKFQLAKKISSILKKPKIKMKIACESYSYEFVENQFNQICKRKVALFIKTKNIGDSIILTSTIESLSNEFEYVNVICLPESEDIFKMHPRVKDIFVIPRNQKGFKKWKSYYHLMKLIISHPYDLVIQFSNDWRGALISRVHKEAYSVARSHFKRGFFWKRSFDILKEPEVIQTHAVNLDFNLLKIAKLNKEGSSSSPHLEVPNNNLQSNKKLLNTSKKIIFIHTQSRWSFKALPLDSTVKIINMFSENNFHVILSGSNEDLFINEKIYRACHTKPFLIKDSSLENTASLMQLSDYVLTVDSMTIHMASALKKPTIAIFGPTNEKIWGPFRVPHKILALSEKNAPKFKCRPCLQEGCNNTKISECLTELTPNMIFTESMNFIQSLH
jgi:ADP-heptose:LPS heptosyltransferase/glycosyltransferase involved in cell wall biosynthesis